MLSHPHSRSYTEQSFNVPFRISAAGVAEGNLNHAQLHVEVPPLAFSPTPRLLPALSPSSDR